MTLIAILANGDYPTHRIPLQALNEAEVIVCCDSAVATMMEQGYSPHPSQRVQVVGDGDSLTPELRKLVPYPIFNESEQDYNDLSKAFRWIMNNIEGLVDISIIGATGKREDHTIGNISLLMDYHERLQQERKGSSVRIVSDYGTFHAVQGEASFESFPLQQVSIFSLTPQVPVSLYGLRYPLSDHCITRWWQATLNEALSSSFSVKGGNLIVYQTHEAKEIPPTI
ncbi:MAG: thiamine diphosphokinase [Bacteroidales bacterium]|nr:thiamine diphosphokinase [Bacteroidales bacterium]